MALDKESKTLGKKQYHIHLKPGDIGKYVLLPGDPARSDRVAKYLDNAELVANNREHRTFTGYYKGKRVSVQGSGMGIPSIGIYSYELFHFYGVENIIRIGTAGGIADQVQLRDLIAGIGACTDSNYAAQYRLPGAFAPTASFALLEKAVSAAGRKGVPIRVGNVLSSDLFYGDDEESLLKWKRMGVLAVEMEAAALYMNAARCGKNALCLLTVSDCPLRGESLPAQERQTGFTRMMEVALELA